MDAINRTSGATKRRFTGRIAAPFLAFATPAANGIRPLKANPASPSVRSLPAKDFPTTSSGPRLHRARTARQNTPLRQPGKEK